MSEEKKEKLENITEEEQRKNVDTVDAADGDDAIEIEKNRKKKFEDSTYYGSKDGEGSKS